MEDVDDPRTGAPPAARDPGVARSVVGALVLALACVVALGLGLLARHHAEASEFHDVDKIEVHERSFGITLESTKIEAGRVGFDVHNDASIPHEFVVFRTNLPADRLPLGPDGDVVEDAPQLRNVADSGSSLAPHSRRAVFATLTPGHYAIVCNLPGHYRLGMRLDVTVTPDGS